MVAVRYDDTGGKGKGPLVEIIGHDSNCQEQIPHKDGLQP